MDKILQLRVFFEIIWIRWGNKEDKRDKGQMRKNEIFKIKQNIKFGDAFIWE